MGFAIHLFLNKEYRIIFFSDKSPNYAFKKRDGTDETLVKYYYDVSETFLY
jgi:hypothetical protein